jgi:ribonuclease P/MRP protein subunit POP5
MMNKNKIKPLLPSLREKKRYLAFEVISKAKISSVHTVDNAISNSMLRLIGESGMAKAGILMLKDKYNQDKQTGIIRVNHKYVDELRASLALIQKVDRQDVIVRSLGLSGILKKAINKFAS